MSDREERNTLDRATEEWRSVLKGYYEVSSLGRVRRKKPSTRSGLSAPGRVLALCKNSAGYPGFGASTGGDRCTVAVHRLVAAAFLGPCPDGSEVNHKDGDKENNRPSNLEYVSPSENTRHALRIGLVIPLKGEAHGSSKLKEADVLAIRKQYQAGDVTQREIAMKFGIAHASVGRITRRENWTHLEVG